jgi:hypothetical protein
MKNSKYIRSIKNNQFYNAALWTLCIVVAFYFADGVGIFKGKKKLKGDI